MELQTEIWRKLIQKHGGTTNQNATEPQKKRLWNLKQKCNRTTNEMGQNLKRKCEGTSQGNATETQKEMRWSQKWKCDEITNENVTKA